MEEDLSLAGLDEHKEQLRLSLLELSRLRRGSNLVNWSDVEAELADREANVRHQIDELTAKERDFEARSKQVLGTIEKRVRSLAESESRLKTQEDQLKQQQNPGSSSDHMIVEVPTTPVTTTSTAEVAPSPPPKFTPEIRVRPFLKSLCENMDAEGLRKYVVDHRKDMGALRNEVPVALQNFSSEPARLVLDAVGGYYNLEANHTSGNNSSSRRACILLLEALATVFGATSGVDYHHPELKCLARDLAEQWRSKMDVHDAPDGHSNDAQAFLQLLATFGLASEYDEEELCGLVMAVSRRKQTPVLCRALNLSHKIPGIVEQLANDGKQTEAIMFAHAFEIMDQINPVNLLKAYLKDSRQKNGDNQTDSLSKELAALKNVLKCIEDYKLQVDFPPPPLLKKVANLERMKSERKRTGGWPRGQAKRPRNGGYARGSYYRGSSENNQQQVYSNASVSPYTLVPQPAAAAVAYDRRGGEYTTYANPPDTRPALVYSVDGAVYNSNVYGAPTAAYNSYQIGGLVQHAYQPAYMH